MIRKTIGDWFREESALLRKEYGLDDTSQMELTLENPKMWTHYCLIEEEDIDTGEGESCNWCGQEEEAQKLIDKKLPRPKVKS